MLPGKDKNPVSQPEPGEIQKWEGQGGEGKPGVQNENPGHPVIPRSKAPTTASSARQDLINASQREMGNDVVEQDLSRVLQGGPGAQLGDFLAPEAVAWSY